MTDVSKGVAFNLYDLGKIWPPGFLSVIGLFLRSGTP